jgi:hypothetical protein
MGLLLQWGCAMIAFCPSCIFYLFRNRPQLYIISLAAAFAWLVSMLFTGMFWSLVHLSGENVWPVTVIVAVLLQEAARFIFIYCFRRTEVIIKNSTHYSEEMLPMNDLSTSLAAGIGFGTMHSLMLAGSLIAASGGEGTLFEDSCPHIPVVMTVALTALGFTILDVIFMIVGFVAERKRSNNLVAVVVVLHMAAALSTLANMHGYGCIASLLLVLTVVLISSALLVWLSPMFLRVHR